MSLKTITTTGGAMPVASPMLATSLGLRPETWTFPDELQAGWLGNGQQSHTRHTAAIRNAMLDFWKAKRPNLVGSDLESFVKARHPLLFDGQRGVFGVNEKRGMKSEAVAGYLNTANEAASGIMLGIGPVLKFSL